MCQPVILQKVHVQCSRVGMSDCFLFQKLTQQRKDLQYQSNGNRTEAEIPSGRLAQQTPCVWDQVIGIPCVLVLCPGSSEHTAPKQGMQTDVPPAEDSSAQLSSLHSCSICFICSSTAWLQTVPWLS